MIDYAYPNLMAERCLKELHQAYLKGDLNAADEKAREAIEYVMEVRFALMKAKDA
jgi:hypothetical protein